MRKGTKIFIGTLSVLTLILVGIFSINGIRPGEKEVKETSVQIKDDKEKITLEEVEVEKAEKEEPEEEREAERIDMSCSRSEEEAQELEVFSYALESNEETIQILIDKAGSRQEAEKFIAETQERDMHGAGYETQEYEKGIVSSNMGTVISVLDKKSQNRYLYVLDSSYTIQAADMLDLTSIDPLCVIPPREARVLKPISGHNIESIYLSESFQDQCYSYKDGYKALGLYNEHIVSKSKVSASQESSVEMFVSSSELSAEKMEDILVFLVTIPLGDAGKALNLVLDMVDAMEAAIYSGAGDTVANYLWSRPIPRCWRI